RRLHTRSKRDWISDVCSSDLPPNWPDDGLKQFHLDLAADDLEAAAARCVELGASRADPQPGETWVVLIDPAGHPFCITDARNWEIGRATRRGTALDLTVAH